MKQFDPPPPPPAPPPPKKHQKNTQKTHKQTVKVSPRLPSTPSNHSSLPSNMLYLQGIHNICSKHKIVQYLRNHNWHSWHLWPCNLPKIQNKFILSLIWSGDNKTQRNTARECIHTHRYTHRGRRKDVLQCCWKRVTNHARNEFFGTRRQNMPAWQNVQAELRNMTQGDKTPEKGPSLTFLAPVRLGGAREAYRKCSCIRGRSNR